MNDRREVVVRCFQVICLTNFFFLLSPSLSLTHTQTQKELWCFFVTVCFAAEEIWNTPRHLSVVSCMFLCVCVCVFECVFTEHVLNSQTHVRHSSPWHTAEVWLIKDEFRGSMTVLFAPPHPPRCKKKRWDERWRENESRVREGRVRSDHPRTALWMGRWPRVRDGWRKQRDAASTRRKSGNSYLHNSLMPAVCLCNYSSFSLNQIPLLPSLPLFFKYPSLCPLPADLCQPPWNHCHIRAFKGHCLASCSHQTYYSLVVQTHTHVRVCVT